jgi:hypothetical protein
LSGGPSSPSRDPTKLTQNPTNLRNGLDSLRILTILIMGGAPLSAQMKDSQKAVTRPSGLRAAVPKKGPIGMMTCLARRRTPDRGCGPATRCGLRNWNTSSCDLTRFRYSTAFRRAAWCLGNSPLCERAWVGTSRVGGSLAGIRWSLPPADRL